jgi:hypothetical protein
VGLFTKFCVQGGGAGSLPFFVDGMYAWFADIKVWKAEASEAWAAERAKLKQR